MSQRPSFVHLEAKIRIISIDAVDFRVKATLLVETFAGRNFRGDKLSRMEEILAKFFPFHAIF